MKKFEDVFLILGATILALLVLPAATMAEDLIPPGNSAVNQYTESLPTPGGKRNSEKGGKKGQRSPGKALGTRNAQRLEEQGPDGRAAAETAAETAPGASVAAGAEGEAAAAPGTGGDNGAGGGEGPPGARSDGAGAGDDVRAAGVRIEEPSGASGLGEALGEATGASSTGPMGWLLPLLILATALWAFAYAMRHRQRAE